MHTRHESEEAENSQAAANTNRIRANGRTRHELEEAEKLTSRGQHKQDTGRCVHQTRDRSKSNSDKYKNNNKKKED